MFLQQTHFLAELLAKNPPIVYHHLESVSTSHKKSARPIFLGTEPISISTIMTQNILIILAVLALVITVIYTNCSQCAFYSLPM